MRIGVLTKSSMRTYFLEALQCAAGSSVEFAFLPHHHCLLEKDVDLTAVLSLQYDRIIDRRTIDEVAHGGIRIINLHFSLLPKYRGMYPIAHALLYGETTCGITYHLIDAGIDTGPIVRQHSFPLGDDDTAETVYERCLDTFASTISEIVRGIGTGAVWNKLTPQDNGRASYFDKDSIDFATDRIVSCQERTAAVWNRFRAFYFPKFQRPALDWHGRLIEVDQLVPIFEHSSRAASRLCGIGKDGVRIETLDGAIEIAAIIENGERVSDSRRILKLLEAAPSTFGG